MQILFTSRIGPDIPMKLFQDYIIFLVWGAWVSLIFILNKNKDF